MIRQIPFSIEVFPPRDKAAEIQFDETLTAMNQLRPDFCSVTYGAGGRSRDGSEAALRRVLHGTRIPVAAHLTCAGQSPDEVLATASRWKAMGVRRFVALRGDAPQSFASPQPANGNFGAVELVRQLRRLGDIDISVACYPETHPEAESLTSDIIHLRRKLDAGADRAISQFFFDADVFFRFRDLAVKHGITQPLVPGILPVIDPERLIPLAKRCGATVPQWLLDCFYHLPNEALARQQVSFRIAVALCEKLIAGGVDRLHFYVLNRPQPTLDVCRAVGIVPTIKQVA